MPRAKNVSEIGLEVMEVLEKHHRHLQKGTVIAILIFRQIRIFRKLLHVAAKELLHDVLIGNQRMLSLNEFVD